MQLSTYSDLRDSNVPWIQSVPSNWMQKRLKFVVELVNQKQSVDQSDLPYIGLEHIESWTGRKIDGEISQSEGLASTYASGDVLFGKLRPYLAKIHLADTPGLVSSEALVIRPSSDISSSFLKYYFLSRDFINTVDSSTYGSKMPRASWDYIGNLPLLIPSAQEQQAIVGFLDHKTAQIDALIAKKQALLEKLAEQRTALISQAVIKGLDPSVPMKDSGVEWLREIPAHWQCRRLRFDLKMNPSKSEIQLDNQDLVSFVPMEAVGEYGGLNLDIEKELSEIGSGYTYFSDNDVVVAKITPCFENRKGAFATGLKNGVAFGTTELHVLRASYNLLPEYLFNITMSHAFAKLGESEMFGAGGQKRVPESFFKDFTIGIPPILEQQEILNYIQDVRCKFSQRFDKVAEMISLLHEYRAALITNAVTGKIDVRDFRLPTSTEQKELAHG